MPPIASGKYEAKDGSGVHHTQNDMVKMGMSLHAPQNMPSGLKGADEAYEAAMDATGTGMLGYTGYEGKDYETDVFDIDDRLDDVKFL